MANNALSSFSEGVPLLPGLYSPSGTQQGGTAVSREGPLSNMAILLKHPPTHVTPEAQMKGQLFCELRRPAVIKLWSKIEKLVLAELWLLSEETSSWNLGICVKCLQTCVKLWYWRPLMWRNTGSHTHEGVTFFTELRSFWSTFTIKKKQKKKQKKSSRKRFPFKFYVFVHTGCCTSVAV